MDCLNNSTHMRKSVNFKLISFLLIISSFNGLILFSGISLGQIAVFLLVIHIVFTILRNRYIPTCNYKHVIYLFFLLIINWYVSNINNIEFSIWMARSLWIIIALLLLMHPKLSFSIDEIKKVLLIVASSKLVFILVAVLIGGIGVRATILFDSPTYSPVILYLSYYFTKEKKWIWLIISLILISLTGSRLLLISAFIIPFAILNLKNKLKLGVVLVFLVIIISPYLGITERLIELLEITEDLSFIGKANEFIVLFDYFKENPLFGKGFGLRYDNGVDIEHFTYSHNVIAYFLGYSGLLGSYILLVFFKKMYSDRDLRYFLISVFIFMLSTTSYTLPDSSLILLLILL